jgi:hypothetical protein
MKKKVSTVIVNNYTNIKLMSIKDIGEQSQKSLLRQGLKKGNSLVRI